MVYVNTHVDTAPQELTPPVSERDHARGPVDAPVFLVEYGDFECPHCGEAFGILRQLQSQFDGELRFVFRNFPLADIHPFAELAAEAAEAAGAQGKYWPMHDALFTHQSDLDFESILGYADEIGLDTDRFREDVQTHRFAQRVREDFESGEWSGVQGTPTYFINGVRYEGWNDLDSLRAAVESAMAR